MKRLIPFIVTTFLFTSAAYAADIGVQFDPVQDTSVLYYRIYWKTDTDNGFVTLDSNTHEIIWSNLAPGNFEFWATAIRGDGRESYPSNKISFTVPQRTVDLTKPDKSPPTESGPTDLTVNEIN